jgi:hypothetical protein
MAFPTLAEIQSNAAVKKETESAPVTEASAPATDPSVSSDGEGSNEPQVETASSETGEGTPSVESQDAATPEETQDSNKIPYNRFKEKVDQVNTLKETNELLQKQLEALKVGAQEVETKPEPEQPDPILEKLNSLDEYEADSDMVKVMRDMAEELKTLRAKASKSEQGVQEIRVQKQVQQIEAEIGSVTDDLKVHDKAGARMYILQTLSKDPSQNVKALADQFSQWEKSQEDIILKRLGVKRPGAKSEATEAEPDVPPRPSTAGAKTGSPAKPQTKVVTLKDLRKTLVSNRRS